MTEEMVAESVTVPLNPFVPLTVIVYVAVELRCIVWFVGLMLIMKSGGDVTVTVKLADRVMLQQVPVTTTV